MFQRHDGIGQNRSFVSVYDLRGSCASSPIAIRSLVNGITSVRQSMIEWVLPVIHWDRKIVKLEIQLFFIYSETTKLNG